MFDEQTTMLMELLGEKEKVELLLKPFVLGVPGGYRHSWEEPFSYIRRVSSWGLLPQIVKEAGFQDIQGTMSKLLEVSCVQ